MIYSVVPKPLAGELFEQLSKHYEGDDNVTVIVDRREFDRRARSGRSSAAAGGEQAQRRIVRDRRRARVPGDLPPLATASA